MSVEETRCFAELKKKKINDESYITVTSKEQITTERLIEKCFDRFDQLKYLDPQLPTIDRLQHIRYLESSLRNLSTCYESLDSSRPWLVYWILNSAQLLNFKFDNDLLNNVTDFLRKCRHNNGGFAGSPGQLPHLAPTYAAVNALCIIGTPNAFHTINRKTLIQFLYSVRECNGAFRMHVGGEVDVRGAYCAISAAKLINLSKSEQDKLFKDTVEWIVSCQTYEGGLGGAPYLEAHGGYSFCGIAALTLLGSTGNCDLKALLRWAVNRQMRYEGGFQGRTNKLVDGCYSFWQGVILPIVQALINKNEVKTEDLIKKPLFNRGALQEYVLICCQYKSGGLIDKPGKPPDLYHTCYALSGISIAQHCEVDMNPLIIGNPDNELMPTHPLHNIPPKAAWHAYCYFKDNYPVDDIWSGNNAQTESVSNVSDQMTDDGNEDISSVKDLAMESDDDISNSLY